MALRGVAILLAGSALLVGGCGLLAGPVAGGPAGGCADIVGGACQEQLARVAARHPGARQVDLTCTAALCDRRGGQGTAVVTLADGTKVPDTFAYTGNPAPVPVPSCTAIALDVCRSVADSAVEDQPPSVRIVAIDVACTAAPCTAESGEASLRITLGDGSVATSSTGWSGGLP